jgi:acetyltransferase-like isoleucine patch superfamily enzyme
MIANPTPVEKDESEPVRDSPRATGKVVSTTPFWKTLRVTWTFVSLFVVLSVAFGLAVLPGALFWEWHFHWTLPSQWLRVVVLSMSFIPAYLIFAVSLMVLMALATRIVGWRTPADNEMSVQNLEWPLLCWVRYTVCTHVVRVFAGYMLRASPLWTLYHRLNGARIGHGVSINSIAIMDHNLLEIGDNTVIGSDVHFSGHTVEGGILKTARVRIGKNVTLGVGSVIGIGVEIGDDAQVGALSVIPKYRKLEPGSTYVGIAAHRLETERD